MEPQEQLSKHRQKVDVDHYDISIREIIGMADRSELHIAPVYQRKFRWPEKDESRLIESLLLGLPVPSVYVATNPDGTWEVVDGLQRLSSIIHFIADPLEILKLVNRPKPLRLSGLDTLTEFNGLTFADFTTPLQLQFRNRLVRLTALSDKSDRDVRFDVFERLNRGGIILTSQEVRACVYTGPFVDLLDELAEHNDFKSLVKLKKGNQQDGTQQELALKYFAYLNNRENFGGRVTEFLNDFIEKSPPKLKLVEWRQEFLSVCKALKEVIEGPILRPKLGWTPQNQLEAILVAAGELIREGNKSFVPKQDWLQDADLVYYSTKGTNTRSMLTGRINRAKELLEGDDVRKERAVALQEGDDVQ